MLNFTWSVFSQTGSVETYLIYKELEKEGREWPNESNDELAEIDSPIS
ncbi:YqzL family protein [Bacillus sp. 165]|nr:YqzL family protein [Bacillus sp. 165]MBO9129603.1 YqzL family protein [Bacillus sp. 165]